MADEVGEREVRSAVVGDVDLEPAPVRIAARARVARRHVHGHLDDPAVVVGRGDAADRAVVVPVPPFAIGKVPVTFEVKSIEPANIPFVTFAAPIVVSPEFEIVTSPSIVTALAIFEALPTNILPEDKVDPSTDADTVISFVPSNSTPLIFLPVANIVAVPALPVTLPEIAFVTVKFANVPTEVNDEFTTVEFNVVPVRVPAAVVMVISEAPSKAVPLIFFDAANLVAVDALPVKLPVTFPVKAAVIVPASKFPLASRVTTLLAVFADTASLTFTLADKSDVLAFNANPLFSSVVLAFAAKAVVISAKFAFELKPDVRASGVT